MEKKYPSKIQSVMLLNQFHMDMSRRVRDMFPLFLRPMGLGTIAKMFPPHQAPNVFPLFSLFAIPAWYYLENKSLYLVFTLQNHKYTSNELLFFIFYFIFIILETSPHPEFP